MNSIDLEFILVLLIFISFLLILISKKGYKKDGGILNWLTYQAKSFLPILLIVLLLRSFLAEPFRIPSGSMLPTLLIGDYILVNKFTYGIRLPVVKTKIFEISSPKRGDVVVFRYPGNEEINFIKRIIGLPGDKISYKNKTIFVNNFEHKKILTLEHDYLSEFSRPEIDIFLENNTKKIYSTLNDNMSPPNDEKFIVPEGKYFVMGDNRDHSSDSRYWGFVPEKNLVGKAFLIWLSFDSNKFSIKLDRVGDSIN